MANKVIHTSGKRKSAIARATIRPGNGIVRVNRKLIDNYEPKLSRQLIREPLLLAGDVMNKVNVSVKVMGGGSVSQATASRLAIARGLVQWSKSDKLEKVFAGYDRGLLVADVRRKESSKPNAHGKARAKRQKSYR